MVHILPAKAPSRCHAKVCRGRRGGRSGSALLPQPGGFEGLLPRLVKTEANHLRFPQVADAKEVAFDAYPAAPAGTALAEHDHHRVPRIDVLVSFNGVVRPRPKPV